MMTEQQQTAEAAIVEVYYRERTGRSFVDDLLSADEALEALADESDILGIIQDVEDAVEEALFRPVVLGPGAADGSVLGAAEWLLDIRAAAGAPRP